MRARWVSRNPSPELPIVGQAKIASFWPGRFYFVSTVQLNSSNALNKLSRSLQGVEHNDISAGPNKFITQVFRCNKDMFVKSFDDPLFERVYSTLPQALIGHNDSPEAKGYAAASSGSSQPGKTRTPGWHFRARARTFARSTPR